MRLLLSLANAVGAGRNRQAIREILKAYANGLDSRALDDVFEQFAWNMGIGYVPAAETRAVCLAQADLKIGRAHV